MGSLPLAPGAWAGNFGSGLSFLPAGSSTLSVPFSMGGAPPLSLGTNAAGLTAAAGSWGSVSGHLASSSAPGSLSLSTGVGPGSVPSVTFSQAAFSLPAGVAAGSTRSTWVPYAGSSVPAWPPVGYGWGQWGGLTGGFPPQSVWWPPPMGPGPVPLLPYVQGVAGGSSSLLSGPSAVPSVPPASSTSLPSVAPVSTSAPVPVAGPSGLG